MQRQAILGRVYSHRFEPELTQRARNSYRNFAAVCDQYALHSAKNEACTKFRPVASRSPAYLGPRMAKSVDGRGRGARLARRDDGAYCLYVIEEQRSRPGC